VKLDQNLATEATRIATGGEARLRQSAFVGRGGRRRFGSVQSTRNVGDMAEKIVEVAQRLALAEPAVPSQGPRASRQGPRATGGLMWVGGSGQPRGAYPFRRSNAKLNGRRGQVPYHNSFYITRELKGREWVVNVHNSSHSASFVEFGTQNPKVTNKRAPITEGDYSKWQKARVQFGGVKGGTFVGGNRKRARYYPIPLKRGRYNRAIRDRQLTHRQRKAKGYQSAKPEARAWYDRRYRWEQAKQGKREFPRRRNYRDSLGRRQQGALIKPGRRPDAVLNAQEDRFFGDAFVGKDKSGDPTLFVRRIDLYPAYAILRRATLDGIKLYLRR
jgi:hypothetical protein